MTDRRPFTEEERAEILRACQKYEREHHVTVTCKFRDEGSGTWFVLRDMNRTAASGIYSAQIKDFITPHFATWMTLERMHGRKA